MPVTRRSDQIKQDRFPGVPRHSLTGVETGSKMLMVGDLIFEPGAEVPYHHHPNAEETQYLVEGELDCTLDGYRFKIGAGDAVLAAPGVPHGFVNRSPRPARMITIFPHSAPLQEFVTPGRFKDGLPAKAVTLGKDLVPTEPYEGVKRFDIIGEQQGARSTLLRLLEFSPHATTPAHYHPETEESMFCLEGELTAVYGRDRHRLAAGDMLTAAPGVRHGISNPSDGRAVLLAIHPTTEPVTVVTDAD